MIRRIKYPANTNPEKTLFLVHERDKKSVPVYTKSPTTLSAHPVLINYILFRPMQINLIVFFIRQIFSDKPAFLKKPFSKAEKLERKHFMVVTK